jgi:hypothetical protein
MPEKVSCPFCGREAQRPRPYHEGDMAGYEIEECPCGARYSYDPTCDSEEDMMLWAERLGWQHFDSHIFHNYSYAEHLAYPEKEPIDDIMSPDAPWSGHLWFIRKISG